MPRFNQIRADFTSVRLGSAVLTCKDWGLAESDRFDAMQYRRSGNSGLKLPVISFGCWFNFGDEADDQTISELIFGAFDLGITHMDLANILRPASRRGRTQGRPAL